MKHLIALILILFVFLSCLRSTAHAGDRPVGDPAVRPLQPWIAELVGYASGASPTLERLLRRLVCSTVIVHLDDDVPPGAGFDGRTRFVGAGGSYRYLKVDIRRASPRASAAGLLAHELQHVVEALDGEVWDVDAFRQLFQRIGHPQPAIGPDYFETREALAIGRRTARELGVPGAWFLRRREPDASLGHRAGLRCGRAHPSQ